MRAIVDILSEVTNRAVAMREDEYVYLDDRALVDAQLVADAIAAQPADTLTQERAGMRMSARQARLALIGVGKLAYVDAALATLPIDTKEAARVEWEHASTVERTHPFVDAVLGTAMGMTAEEIDALFVSGAAL